MELKTLTGQLADESRSAKTRLEAAAILLSRPYPQAARALKGFLVDSANRSAQIAVAEAVAQHGGGSEVFIKPLMEMLTGREPTVRPPAVRALVTYKDQKVIEGLISVARDVRRDKLVRLVVIAGLQRVPDKSAVNALVSLLDDSAPAIRDAAADALTKLTNIRFFGTDRAQWKRWWARNKSKDRSEWLSDLAEGLSRARAALETDNARLRGRLARAMGDLYTATPAAQREAMLLSFLKDPLGDVRLVGISLAGREVDAGRQCSQEVRSQVRAILGDSHRDVRQAAAMLLARLPDGPGPGAPGVRDEAMPALLRRLEVEDVPAVREAVLMALGQLAELGSLPAVLAEIPSEHDNIAAAAAGALARIAAKGLPEAKQRANAAEALLRRYRLAELSPDGSALREALLTAMGVVGDKAAEGVLEDALSDVAATIRLAAVEALAKLGQPGSATAIGPLVADPDRGVRQAAIAALGKLGSQQHLQGILQRTDPAVEPDAAVRQRAWEVAMEILSTAEAEVLWSVCDSLAHRPDAGAQRIKVMGMLVDVLRADSSARLPEALRRLGLALMAASRPAEAAPYLADAHAALNAAEDPGTTELWAKWIDALLAADDPAVLKVMAEQDNDQAFASALKRFEARLAELNQAHNFLAVTALGQEAISRLPHRLTVEQRERLEKRLAHAESQQSAADRQRVDKLLPQLLAGDEPMRTAATSELRAMGDRAVRPLLEELKKTVGSAEPNSQAEKAILDILEQIAPKLTGYDPAAEKAVRIKTIDSWTSDL